jgi:long-subunit acyl-CoA synthetase (AMP-forming)
MITLYTSGTTKAPKKVIHSWEKINKAIDFSIIEIDLTSKDVVLDVFPANTVAHYTVTAMPAYKANAKLVSTKFDARDYIKIFKEIKPTYIALIPRHWELLQKEKEWEDLDMSCVRYMVTGSGAVSQELINDFNNKGIKTVANWYGMTEVPPPVFIGYNSINFDLNTAKNNHIEFQPISQHSNIVECIIDGWATGDLFNLDTMEFFSRREISNGCTWKTI